MKRSGFQRPQFLRPARVPLSPAASAMRSVIRRVAGLVTPISKEGALQHAGYMDIVRSMPCAHCGWPARSQFCHSDQGKGAGIKTDCRLGYPGCGPHSGLYGLPQPGCHWLIGTSGTFPKDARRELESRLASQTRTEIKAAGLWPTTLPLWPADTLDL